MRSVPRVTYIVWVKPYNLCRVLKTIRIAVSTVMDELGWATLQLDLVVNFKMGCGFKDAIRRVRRMTREFPRCSGRSEE